LALAIGAAYTSSAAPASLGASFIGRGANGDQGPAGTATLSAGESAGVVAQTNWNNVDPGTTTFKGTSAGLIDSSGGFTSVRVIFDCSDSWNSGGTTTTPNDKLMKGIIKANPEPDLAPINNSERMLFTITNLPAGNYNVFAYLIENDVDCAASGGGGTACAEATATLGATSFYVSENATFGGSFTKATSTTPGSFTFANYAEWDNVPASGSGTISFTVTKNVVNPQVTDGIGVAAIQVVQVSGGAYPPNTDTCSILSGPTPTSTLTVAGSTATFSVTTAGPSKVQWTKNGTAIPGGTDRTLVYTAALADDNAQFRAVVYNNVITNTSSAATLSVDAPTSPTLTQGFMKVEQWQNIGTNLGFDGIADLKTNIAGSGVTGTTPTRTYFVSGASVPQTSPNWTLLVTEFGAGLNPT